MEPRFQVRGYSDALWCVVDCARETRDELPLVRYHESVGWKTTFSDPGDAAALALRMNQEAAKGTKAATHAAAINACATSTAARSATAAPTATRKRTGASTTPEP
jgi:hypothetical protein